MEKKFTDLRKVCLVGIDTLTTAVSRMLRRRGFRGTIYALDGGGHVKLAWAARIATDGGESYEEALRQCDLIVLSFHAKDYGERLLDVLVKADPDSLILDMSSVKGHEEAVVEESGRKDVRYVGFHQMNEAALEVSLEKVNEFYFDHKAIILTPRAKEDYASYRLLADLFESSGATAIAMSPQDFHRRLALLNFVPDLLDFVELELALGGSEDEHISVEYLGPRLYKRLEELAERHQTEWYNAMRGCGSPLGVLLNDLSDRIASIRNSLCHGELKDRVTKLLERCDYLIGAEETVSKQELLVMTGGDPKILERISVVLAEARLAIDTLHRMSGDTNGAFKLVMKTDEDKTRAAQLLQGAGIEVMTVD
ncbi:prephenate dehydrogenase/arogenate dehydrogenase family protein [bacterium]|nr:prephenate dehydrogenase/arogenate dehydrogenase family protein [bacterium]